MVFVLKSEQNVYYSLFHRASLDIFDETLNNWICFSFFSSLGKKQTNKTNPKQTEEGRDLRENKRIQEDFQNFLNAE